MKTRSFCLVIAAMLVMVFPMSCNNGGERPEGVEVEKCEPLNPIDSIIDSTVTDERLSEVYKYLLQHPDFVVNSDSVGYHRWGSDEDDVKMIWKDCGNVRVYSIPEDHPHASYHQNFVQFIRPDGGIDSTFLNDNAGGLEELFSLRCSDGKTVYILRTSLFYGHQGNTKCENISAFSMQGNRLVKEKLFHAKERQYDNIEVCCGGHRYLPLDFGEMVLIGIEEAEESGDVPMFVIAEINDADWPTGLGLKYVWKGDCFEYVGKCKYDANGYIPQS